MPSDLKRDSVICLDCVEPELCSLNGKIQLGERANAVYKVLVGSEENNSFSKIVTTVVRRTRDRFFNGNRAAFSDKICILFNKGGKQNPAIGNRYGPFLSGTAYCISSCSMILLNKVVLSSYNFDAGISLMFYQNLIASIVVIVLGLFGVISVEKLNWRLARVWIPVNVIFVGMLVTGMYSLKYINIAMVTILKNVTNILTATGELYMFRKRQNNKVWSAMFLMIVSAFIGGITDLSFDAVGYAWQMLNCILTASYSLTLRRAMDKAKEHTRYGTLNEVSMVLLNNLLSLPFGLFLTLIFDEWEYLTNLDILHMPKFWLIATASGLLGLAISFASMWFLHQTGPTTYSLVGSLNKIPISIAGLLLFKVPLSLTSFFSILFGLFAGVFFARAKMS